MTTKLWPVAVLSLIALVGCAGDGGSTAATKPSGTMASDSSAVTSGQSGAATGVLTLDPATGAFGTVKVGVRKAIAFKVTNPPTDAAFSAILSGPDAGQFVMAGGTCFAPIRSGARPNPCTMEVMLMATSTGAKSASLDVAGSATVSLTGTAVAN